MICSSLDPKQDPKNHARSISGGQVTGAIRSGLMVSESLITDREASLFRIRFDNFPVGADPISVRVIDVSMRVTGIGM
jgi:hypothetical protein